MNLGPQKWQDAAAHFGEASKAYGEAGNEQRQKEAYALSYFFAALTINDQESWLASSRAMASLGETQVNVGFNANATDISRQSQAIHDDMEAMAGTAKTGGTFGPAALRKVAQEYMDLVGAELVPWRLLKQEVDPGRRANYFLGLASLSEANTTIQKDPRKAASMLAQAVTHLEISQSDPLNVMNRVKDLRDRVSVVGKCWLCGREVQGKDIHFVTLPAEITMYMREKHGTGTPPSLMEQGIVACQGCYSSVKNLADSIARRYYEQAINELRQTEARLNAMIQSLSSELHTLRSRVNRIPGA